MDNPVTSPVILQPLQSPPPIVVVTTDLQREIDEQLKYLRVLGEFERKHHGFLIECDNGGYFLNETDGAVVFYADRREEVSAYFGGDRWRLGTDGFTVSKNVEGVTVRLIVRPDDVNTEISI